MVCAVCHRPVVVPEVFMGVPGRVADAPDLEVAAHVDCARRVPKCGDLVAVERTVTGYPLRFEVVS